MSDQIVTSVGRLGAERRSYDRLYATLPEPVDDYDTLVHLQHRMNGIVERTSLTRSVIRAVVAEPVLKELATEQPDLIETALPLDGFDSAGSWLVMLAQNQAQRAFGLTSQQTMLEATSRHLTPFADTAPELAEGYRVVNNLSESGYSDLLALWGSTFEWTEEAISSFGTSLAVPVETPQDRSLWFSALLCPEGKILSAAMAERLQVPGFDKTINIVESTEWRTDPRHLGQGLLPLVLRDLHDQILDGVPESLIVAECNFATRADKAGHRVGMVVPDRTYAPQILTQNVVVADGVAPAGLRDFTYMWLPSC